MLATLRREACEVNRRLPREGLAPLNFGNASAIDRARGIVAIKPSGVDYASLRPGDLVLVDLEGRRVEGTLRPSSDTPTHLELYRAFPGIGGVVHTHSPWAVAFAQAMRPIPALGTTHADFFRGAVPVTRALARRQIEGDYEAETGRSIRDAFRSIDPLEVPAVLVRSHGPFAWGLDVEGALEHAIALEFCACAAARTLRIDPRAREMDRTLRERHFLRKHGPASYYGQEGGASSKPD
ncbi:MAG: L-ribulose-5-phosphate 4-epimerase AraD [Opitutaceae bacterium]